VTTMTSIEREVKLRYASAEEAREAVLAAGAVPLLGRRLQEDALFDTRDDQLKTRRSALRLRRDNGKTRLTFKGPVQPDAMKVREELETVVADGDVLHRVFEELGLRVWFRYQKFREEFSHQDVIVAIDETPVGVFVELEGSEQGITDMTSALGRSSSDYIVQSYYSLFLEHEASRGSAGGDMLFPGE
jgi:adenylate cyclase, class 2